MKYTSLVRLVCNGTVVLLTVAVDGHVSAITVVNQEAQELAHGICGRILESVIRHPGAGRIGVFNCFSKLPGQIWICS